MAALMPDSIPVTGRKEVQRAVVPAPHPTGYGGPLRAYRATRYLLGQLVTALMSVQVFVLLCHPAVRGSWSGWHHNRAGRLLGQPVVHRPLPLRRYVCWLGAHVTVGLTFGLCALLCVGNVVLAVGATVLWWLFPAQDPALLLINLPVTSWNSAVVGGPVQAVVLTAVGYLAFPVMAHGYARLSMTLLAPSEAERLANRIEVLTRSRTDALQAHSLELRRIERDLHDGTQARLVAIALRLGVARRLLHDRPDVAGRLLEDVQDVTEEAMTELRGVIRSVCPPVLADRGLTGALRTVVARGAVPTQLEVGALGPVPAAVEAAAYFAVTEALTNVTKHSGATRASVRLEQTGGLLWIAIHDDGVGGADEATGTGLAGIRHRAQAFDGTVTVDSPSGGPTTVTVELPCG
jgi:signal transduction histidine kinase